jgi:Cu(I)/Ag(I) efflux system membrane fusion protein
MKTKYILIIMLLSAVSFLSINCGKDNNKNQTEQKEYYTCTMHPQVISDKPGVCPICGMELIKKVANESNQTSSVNQKDMEGMITLSNKKQILANVSTVKVSYENLDKELTSYSYMDFVEQNRVTISARFNGRLEKLFVNKTGDEIKKGQPLFEIYSPDLIQAQNEYLISIENSKGELNNSAKNSLLIATRRKLEILGLTSEQINEIESTNEIKMTLTYYSPVSGTVIEKKVQEGMYINEGTSIYEIADLSTLWNIAEVYEKDLSSIKPGGKVKLYLAAYPEEEFEGKVTFIYPVVNSQTRTVKVRSEFSNNRNKLKPQMYGETVFHSSYGKGLLIPADAIIFTGKRTIVWVKVDDGMFEARNVKIGEKYKNKYQIISGLNSSDEIAATGGFLIDSESQLKTGMLTGHQHDDGSNTTDQKKSSPDNMEGMDMPK